MVCEDLACTFTDLSTDEDGDLVAHAWSFGDGAMSVETNATHTYAGPGGHFLVTLTVTDDGGAVAMAEDSIHVTQPANIVPIADFEVVCDSLTCTLTSASTDVDGTIVAQAWDFGDGGASTEAAPIHTFPLPPPGGLFVVTLSVTDDRDSVATKTKQVSLPSRRGTYVREVPHSTPGRHSRFVIRDDATFELHDGVGSDTTVHTGRWRSAMYFYGLPMPPGKYFYFTFDSIVWESSGEPGEAYVSYLADGDLGVAYNWVSDLAGLEEGPYTTDPDPAVPDLPPPVAGQIAFVRDGAIYRVNTAGDGLLQLSDGINDHELAWSPDGTRIAFTRESGGARQIFIMDADGSNLTQRTVTTGGQTGAARPTWSPDGEWIAYSCTDAAVPGSGLCTLSVANDSAPPVVIHQSAGLAVEPAWSPDGSRIAFVSDDAFLDVMFDVWTIAPDGSGAVLLRPGRMDDRRGEAEWRPAWAPDGQRLALVECPSAFHYCSSAVLTVLNADGSGAVRLVVGSGYSTPTWSPDGSIIAVGSSNGIEWVSADGSQRGRIIADGHTPAWRP